MADQSKLEPAKARYDESVRMAYSAKKIVIGLFVIGLILLTAFKSNTSQASVICRPDIKHYCLVTISGSIKEGDADVLRKVLFDHVSPEPNKPVTDRHIYSVSFNSSGGSVNEAMKIGKVLRERRVHAIVIKSHICFSSCVFALMGAVERNIIFGQIGIHRPYFGGRQTQDVGSLESKIQRMKSDILDYVRSMNISTNVVEDMYAIRPEDLRILTQEELIRYGIEGVDVVEDELEIQKLSEQYGISPSQAREGREKTDKECDIEKFPSDEYDNCERSKYYRVSEAVIADRVRNARLFFDTKFKIKCFKGANGNYTESCLKYGRSCYIKFLRDGDISCFTD